MSRMLAISVSLAGRALAIVLLPGAMAEAQSNDCTITLQPSEPSPQLVGERIIWTATAANCGDTPVYQFRVAYRGDATLEDEDPLTSAAKHRQFKMVRDFSPDNTLAWAPMQEGLYHVKVSVKDGFATNDSAAAVVSDTVNSRVTGADAVVAPTQNPLVALYSTPPCMRGTVFVRFRAADDPHEPGMTTNSLPCVPGLSRNFVVAGMRANTTYVMEHVTRDGSSSPPLFYTTEAPPPTLDIPTFTVRQAPGPETDLSQNMIYHNLVGRPAGNAVNLLATDLMGRVEWYYDTLQSGLTRVGLAGANLVPGGTLLLEGSDRYAVGIIRNVLREIDLAGNPMRETNVDAVNAQLIARGQEPIYGFHHDFPRLPVGHTATLGWTRRTVDVNGIPIDYVGDMIIVLDENFQVVWTWDAFDHLDVSRGPILGETCANPCPIPGAVDWLHDNAVARSATDGNLLISVRHQDWVIKIDYADGTGDGHIIWRLGADGDFAIDSTDPYPWFSPSAQCPLPR